MSIRVKTEQGLEIVEQTAFAVEVHLQEILAGAPNLLRQAGESAFALVVRELDLKAAGSLDILLVSSDGLPVAVEVKLESNGGSRREVVAQAVDYLSALADYTNDELDNATNGKLSAALRSFEPETPDEEFERRWAAVGTNLRAGLGRVLIAVDAAPPGLERIVRFLAESSDLDIQLVAIERYNPGGVGEIIVPRFLVSGESTNRREAPTKTREAFPELLAVVNAYNRMAAPDLQTSGAASYYRLVRPTDWRPGSGVHYEFYRTSSWIGAELHLESDKARPIASLLQPLAGLSLFDASPALIWDQSWSAGRGRLSCRFPSDADPDLVARSMVELITRTRNDVSAKISEVAGA